MSKIEHEKINLAPLNMDQIRLSGQIVSSQQKKSITFTAQQIKYLELMQNQNSISEISNTFLKQGKLVSFTQIKELIIFLVQEGLIENPTFINYLHQKTVSDSKSGFFENLFKQEKQASDVSAQIRQVPFFRSLPPEITELFLAHHRVVHCPSDVKVCQAGQFQRSLLCVLEGSLSVYKRSIQGEMQHTADISAGSVFGETGFFLNQARTADVITTSESLIVKFKYVPEIFDPLIQKEKAQSLQKRIWLIHALLASDLFNGLPDDCFDSLIYAGNLTPLKTNTLVFAEGQRAESFFIIIQGNVQVLQNQKIIRHLSQGDCFGEIALLLTGGLRTAAVVCESDCLLLEIGAQKFYQMLGDNLFLACEFEKISTKRVQADQLRRR